MADERFVYGAERLGQRIATIRTKLALPPLVNEISELLLRRTLDRFDRQVDPDGQPWRSHADSTVRKYGEHNLLNMTGALRASIKVIRSSTGSVYSNTGAGSRIGVEGSAGGHPGGRVSIASVAKWMQRGTPTVPARRFLGIGRLDVKAVDSFMRRRADKVIGES